MPTLPFYDEWKQDEAFTASPDAVKTKALQLYFDDNLADDEFRKASPALQGKARQLFMSDHLGAQPDRQPSDVPVQQPEKAPAVEPGPEEERGILENAWESTKAGARGLAAGSAGLGEMAGSAVQWLGNRLPENIGGPVSDVGRKVADYYEKEGKSWTPPGELQGSVWDKPELLADGRWWTYNVGQFAPSMIAAMAPGLAAKGIIEVGGKALSLTPEVIERLATLGMAVGSGAGAGGMEGTGTYREMLRDGKSEQEASAAGVVMASLCTGLNALGFGAIFSKVTPMSGPIRRAGKHLLASGTEGVTEMLEEPSEELSKAAAYYLETGEMIPDLPQKMADAIKDRGLNVLGPAALMGGGMSVISGHEGKLASDPKIDVAIRKGADMAAEPVTKTYKGLLDSGQATIENLKAFLANIDPDHPVTKEIKANLQKLTSDQAPPIELTEDMVVEEEPIELTDDMIVDQPIGLPGISEPSGKSAEESAVAIEQAEAQTERVRQSPEGYQSLKKQLADRAEEADQIGSYLESYHSSLNEGTPGGRFRTEDLDGTQQWHGEASSYKSLPWWQEGFSKRKAMKAIEWGLSGKPFPDSERGKGMISIWDAALEGAKEQYAGDVYQWAKEVEADPKAIDGMTPIQYKKALGVLKDEGFETKPIEDAWRGYTGEIQEGAVKAIAGQQNISEEEIRSIIESEQEPGVTFEAAWEDLSDADREFIDGHRASEEPPTEPVTIIAAKEKPMPGVALEEKADSEAPGVGNKVKPKDQVHDYSSTQVDLPEAETKAFQSFGKKIPDAEIYEDPRDPSYGREDEPHITVKYGLDTVDPKEVEPLLSGQVPITAKMGKVSIFESDEYDVVKVDIESPELHALNKKIVENLKVTDTYPEYKPHATIAYVKKGEGQKYVGDSSFEGKEIVFDSLVFSGKDGKLTEIPLRGAKLPSETVRADEEQQIDIDVSKKTNQPSSPKLVSLPESSGVGEAPHDRRGKNAITPKDAKRKPEKIDKKATQLSKGRQKSTSTRAVKTTSLPESLSKAFAMGKLSKLKAEPGTDANKDYRRAKYHGDVDAADRVALRMLNEKKLKALEKALDPDKPVLFVPVVNSEKNGQLNALPHRYAKRLSQSLGGTVHGDIVKTSGKPNTGATLEDRVSREIEFDGNLPEGDFQVVIVDDNFTSGKTTMALLGHLQSLGADVRAVTTMAYSARNGAQIKPTDKQLDKIREYAKVDPESQGRNIDDYIREVTGHGIDQYTGAEANAVAKKRSKQSFRSFYPARNVEKSSGKGTTSTSRKVHNAPATALSPSIAQNREADPQSLEQLRSDILTWLEETLPPEALARVRADLTAKIDLKGKNTEMSTRQWKEIDPTLDTVMGAATVGHLRALIELSYNFDNATIQGNAYHESFHVASKWLLPDADYARILKFYGNEEKAAIAFQKYAMERAAGKGHSKGRIRQIFAQIIKALQAIRNGLKGKGFDVPETVFGNILGQKYGMLPEAERMARVDNLSSLNMGNEKPEISDNEFIDALLAKYADKEPGLAPDKFSRPETGKGFDSAIRDVAGRKRRTWQGIRDDIREATRANGVTRIFDRFNPVNTVGEDAYRRYRLTTGAMSTFARFLEDGKLALDEDMTPVVQTKGKGVLTWMKTLGADAEKMLWWVAVKRAEQLETEGREHWLTQEKRDVIMSAIPSKPKNGASWKSLNAKFQGFNRNILDYAQSSGLIDPEARKEWEQEFYVPFYRLRDESMDAFLSGPMKSGKHISAQIKRLTGQDARLGDLFENTMKNWAHLVQESSRNVAAASAFMGSGDVMSSMVDVDGNQLPAMQRMSKQDLIKILGSTSEKAWAVKMLGKRARKVFDSESDASNYLSQLTPGYIIEPRIEKRVMMAHAEINNIMSFRAEGAPVHVKINDVELFNAMTNSNAARMNEFLRKMLGGPKRVLTYTATFGPAFRVANMLRDTVHTSLVSKSFIPFLDTAIGMGKALKQDKDWISFQSSGAGQGASYLHAEDPKAMANYVKRVIKKDGTSNRILDTPKKLKGFLDWWEKIGAASEDAARVQLFAKRIAEGESRFDAAFEARDLLDFTMRGDSHIVQYLIQGLPFMNARMQGLYKLGRVAKADPKSFGVKMSIFTLASLALWAFGQDDDDFDEHYGQLEGWEKRTYYNFWVGDYQFRIPRPFELGIFPMLLEATLDSLKGTDEPVHVFKAIGHSISDTLAINPFPQAIRPLAEQWANKTFFTGRPIEGMGLKNLLPSQRKKPYTPTTLGAILNNDLADKLGVSPVRAEALIRGYLSTVGMLALGVSDVLIQNIGSYPVKPTRSVGNYPLIGRFMKNSKDQRNSKYLTRFYALSNEVNEIYSTVNNYEKLGDLNAAKELVENKKQDLRFRGLLMAVRRQVAKYNRDTRQVMADREIGADKKRDLINSISDKKLRLVEKAVRTAIGQAVRKKPRKRVAASTIKNRMDPNSAKNIPKLMRPKAGAIAGEWGGRPMVRKKIIGGQR